MVLNKVTSRVNIDHKLNDVNLYLEEGRKEGDYIGSIRSKHESQKHLPIVKIFKDSFYVTDKNFVINSFILNIILSIQKQ